MKKISKLLFIFSLLFLNINGCNNNDHNLKKENSRVKRAVDIPTTTQIENIYIGSSSAPFEFVAGGSTTDGSSYKTTFKNFLTTFNQYYIDGMGEFSNEYSVFQNLDYNYIQIDVQLPYSDTASINPLLNRRIVDNDLSYIQIGYYSPTDPNIGGTALYSYNELEHTFNAGTLSSSQWVSSYKLSLDMEGNKLEIPTNIMLYFTIELINVEPLFVSSDTGYNIISATCETNYISLRSEDLEHFINRTNENYYNNGYNSGYANGKNDGYNLGYADGVDNKGGITGFIISAFNVVDSVLSVEILPKIKLWYIVGIPLVLSVVKFILGWFR